MRPEIQELVNEKIYQLRRKGFDDIEMLNRNTFKARNSSREACKLKIDDRFYLHMNGEAIGFLK